MEKPNCLSGTRIFTELPNAFRRAVVPAEQTDAEVDFLVKVLPAGCRVLDVPCGSGRHALELARRGYRVTGVDVSAEAIEFAQGPQRLRTWRPTSGART